MKILIIDDNPTDLKLFVDILEHAGHETIQADNAEEALLVLREQAVNLILVDVMLPGMDGLALAGRLKGDKASQGIPIVATSALTRWPFKRIALSMGCDAFISKPVNTRKFSLQIAAIIDKVKN